MGYESDKRYLGLSDRRLAGMLKHAPGTVGRYGRAGAPVAVEEFVRTLAEAKERLERFGFVVLAEKKKPRGRGVKR